MFRETSRVLWCVAVGVVGDRELGEDILQEAALLALGKLDTFRPGTSFGAWMGQFVRYLALNHRRKRERRRRALDAEGPPPMSATAKTLPTIRVRRSVGACGGIPVEKHREPLANTQRSTRISCDAGPNT